MAAEQAGAMNDSYAKFRDAMRQRAATALIAMRALRSDSERVELLTDAFLTLVGQDPAFGRWESRR